MTSALDLVGHELGIARVGAADRGAVDPGDAQPEHRSLDGRGRHELDPHGHGIPGVHARRRLARGVEELHTLDPDLTRPVASLPLLLVVPAIDVHTLEVLVDNGARGPDRPNATVVEQHRLVAEAPNGFQRVGHDDDRLASLLQVVELLRAALLELGVANREDLVEQQHVGIHVDRNREAEPQVHARRVVLHRAVDELLQPRELDDLVEALGDLLLRQAEDRAVEEHVLAPRELEVKARPELEERRQLAGHRDAPVVGTQDLGHALQQRALARPVVADEAERGPRRDVERHVTQRPELLVPGAAAAEDHRLQRLIALVVQPELLRHVDNRDRSAHTSSASRRSRRPNTQCPMTSRPIAHAVR